jgi:hypothetical protein
LQILIPERIHATITSLILKKMLVATCVAEHLPGLFSPAKPI